MTDGPWIHETTWNFLVKEHVGGTVSWPNAKFSNTVIGDSRTLLGNALPMTHTTGTFPVGMFDPAYQYDRNPNFINAQNLKRVLPAHPVYSDTPYCMGGEAGIMLSGVPLFNAFDAELRDASRAARHARQRSALKHRAAFQSSCITCSARFG